MAIAKHKPDTDSAPQPALPEVQPAEYRGIVYDDDHQPLRGLISFMEGSPWSVEYFSQIIGEHNDVRVVDVGQSATYQQYNRICNMEIRVTAGLSNSYDEETGLTTSEGTANMIGVVLPNNGDSFVAEAGEKLKGIFTITNVVRNALSRESTYQISYKLQCYVVQQPGVYQDLRKKTVRNYVFDKSRLLENLQPLLKTEDWSRITNLHESFMNIVVYYFSVFFNQRFYMLLLPGQDMTIYDPFLMQYILTIVDRDMAPEIRHAKIQTLKQDPLLTQPQFFSILSEKNHFRLSQCNKKMQPVERAKFFQSSFFGGFALNATQFMMYPITVDESAQLGCTQEPKWPNMPISLADTKGDHGNTLDYSDLTFERSGELIPLIKPAHQGGFYVLSEDFYNDTDNLSVLEILTRDYLKNATIDLDMLSALVSSFTKWRRMDQFYYGPVIMTLILECRRATYTT